MTKNPKTVVVNHEETKLTYSGYITGFISSLLITLVAYSIVSHRSFSHKYLIGVIVALALVQFIVQLYFFLHLGKETKPRWKLGVFLFMIGVVFIIVFGSLWIMTNLNYRMSIPQEIQYNNSQDGL